MNRTPRHTWVPYVAALAGAALTLKGTLILGSGNRVDETTTGVLYLGGLLLGLVACVGVGLRQHGVLRGIGLGLGSTLLLVGWIIALSDAVEPAIGAFSDRVYVRDEAPVLLAGLVLLVLAWLARARDLRADDPSQPLAPTTA